MAEAHDEDTETTEAECDSDRLKEVHERAMRRFDQFACQQELRALSLKARRFVTIPGAQWEDEWGEQFENSIKVESNKVSRGLRKIETDYRENRIVPEFRPDGEKANDETAETLAGLHRADSYRFKSQQARDNAAFEAFAGGFGAYRLSNEWEDESDKTNDNQRVNPASIITDADQSVFFDLNARLTEDYVDITVANASLASSDVLIQNLDDDMVDIVCAASVSGQGPIRLDTLDSVQVNSANIWVRGTGNISATLV